MKLVHEVSEGVLIELGKSRYALTRKCFKAGPGLEFSIELKIHTSSEIHSRESSRQILGITKAKANSVIVRADT